MSTVRFVVGRMSFEWEAAKAATNRRKHGVSFEEAATVFGDPLERTMDDPDDASGEARLLIPGMSTARRLVVVAHIIERGADENDRDHRGRARHAVPPRSGLPARPPPRGRPGWRGQQELPLGANSGRVARSAVRRQRPA